MIESDGSTYYDFDGRPCSSPGENNTIDVTEYLPDGSTRDLGDVARFGDIAMPISKESFDRLLAETRKREPFVSKKQTQASPEPASTTKTLTSLMGAEDLKTPEQRKAYAGSLTDEIVEAVQARRRSMKAWGFRR